MSIQLTASLAEDFIRGGVVVASSSIVALSRAAIDFEKQAIAFVFERGSHFAPATVMVNLNEPSDVPGETRAVIRSPFASPIFLTDAQQANVRAFLFNLRGDAETRLNALGAVPGTVL